MNDSANPSASPFQVFLRRLTNLSGNSKMLFLPRITEGKHFDFHQLGFLNNLQPFSLIGKIIKGKAVPLCPLSDARVPAVNPISRSLKLIKRSANFLFEEGGTKDLYVGWPFVRGKFAEGTWVNCPLLLFPVDLVESEKEWKLVPREGTSIAFNKTFLLALSFYNKTPLAESLLEEDFEDIERDSTVFRTALYSLFQREKLEINFNPDTYQDVLHEFEEFKKDQFDTRHPAGNLKLFSNAILGIFPQADSYLVPDYIDLIQKSKFNTLEDFFLSKSSEAPLNPHKNFIEWVKEDRIVNPFSTDSFQENILKAVKHGQSVVVQGPPGSGKSQLICNLLSDALANNRNVLVVCQKRAALDVVYTRMQKAGFSEFLALVHDFKNDRKEIYSRIASQIDRVNEYKVKVNSLDAIQLERGFSVASKKIDQATEELEALRKSLFDTMECGMAVKELYLNTDSQAETINVKQEYAQFRMDRLPEIISKIRSLGSYIAILEQEPNPWRNRKLFINLPASALPEIKSILADIPETLKSISDTVKELTNSSLDYQQAEIFSDKLEDLKLLKSVLTDETVYRYLSFMSTAKKGETDVLWIQNQQRLMDDLLKGESPEETVESAQLGKFQQVLNRSLKAQRNIFKLIQWELFSEEKYLIKRTLVANGLSGREGLKILERKLDIRLNLEHNITKLRTREWIKEIPVEYNRATFETWFNNLVLAARCNNLFDEIRNLKNFLSPHINTHQHFTTCLHGLIECLETFLTQKARWSKYLSNRQIEEVGMDFNKVPELTGYLQNHFDTMCEYDNLLESLTQTEKELYQRLVDATDFKSTADELCDLLNNSLGLAWIDHIESKHPELRMVSSGKLGQLERELQESIFIKSSLCKELVTLRARERVIETLEYNRLNNLITYRDLNHEVTKKKKIWPLRKLIHNFHEELFKVIPIWLASPESVSAIFPPQGMFDLVIFDEASQCFSERGLPAVMRARQVVVAGDQQQLRPGDFFRNRWEEDPGNPDLEVESLLELASRHWLTLTLQNHYRSYAPELVQFSNQHFYKNKLELLPHRKWVNSQEKPIQLIKVEGQWKNHTNEVEAEKVAELVLQLTEAQPRKEIGVITFNQPQQILVFDKVEEKFAHWGLTLPDTLMIKNIENVQGDEKDIIIFSIGYARNEKGRLTIQFGSLNAAGGENRLNVAITRAREKIMVVTSIFPEELKTETATNDGPKLLKEYLRFVQSVSEGDRTREIARTQLSFDWYLKYKLTLPINKIVYDLFPNADITIEKNGAYSNIIITDDEFYQRSLSAKYHHALLPRLLEEKGWIFTFLYSRNFWLNRERTSLEVEKMWK